MEKRIESGLLFDFYGPLLTQRQQYLLRLYLEEDLTLAEIAGQEDISRQGVYDTVHRAVAQLAGFERQLGLVARFAAIQAGLSGIEQLLQAAPSTSIGLEVIRQVRALMDEEGNHGL